MLRFIAVLAAATGLGLDFTPAATASVRPVYDRPADCCEGELDWANPYYEALKRHGLGYLADQSIGNLLATQNACGLVPAIGAVRTIEKLSRDYKLNSGQAGKVVVAAADVCPEILSYLG